MQSKKSVKKWNLLHYAVKPLFYQTPLVLLLFGQK